MYSDELIKYLLEYQKEDFKPVKEKTKKRPLKFDVVKKQYATVPIDAK